MADDRRCVQAFDNHILNLLDIPPEILELILTCGVINHEDVGSIACTCSRLRDAAYSEKVWKALIENRWPGLIAKYDRSKSYTWRHEYITRDLCGRIITEKMAGMSLQHLFTEELSKKNFSEFATMLKQREHPTKFVIDELLGMIHFRDKHTQLTEKYYAEKVLRFIRHLRLKQLFQKFLQLPSEEMSLERAMILVAMWCQPLRFITLNGISDKLDDIVHLVKVELKNSYPKHPYLSCKDYPVPESVSSSWSSTQKRRLLETLNHTLFDVLQFSGNMEDYYDPKNSYINKVLERKTGIPLSLSVLYQILAKRLGVVCELVNFPSHFLLKWKEHPHMDNGQQYTFIDAFHKGRFMSQEECITMLNLDDHVSVNTQMYNAVPPRQVLEMIVQTLVDASLHKKKKMNLWNSLELSVVICPNNMETRRELFRFNLQFLVNLTEAIEHLQLISSPGPEQVDVFTPHTSMIPSIEEVIKKRETLSAQKIVPKLRSKNPGVDFSVGMIMKHKRQHYKCVIYEWEPDCIREAWYVAVQMDVHNLSKKQYQPFYRVLLHNGSNRYVAEEDLEFIAEPCVIPHPDVGKYFSTYCGYYYEANEAKVKEYPEDRDITIRNTQERFK